MDDVKKRKKELYNIVKQMIIEDKKKVLAQINISAVLKSLK